MISSERNFIYSDQVQTSIFLEEPAEDNPYNSQKNYIHGYDVLALASKKSFSETLILLFTGELPSDMNSRLMSLLQIGFMNLGPRYPAVKAAMVAGVSKTNTEHLLPIGLSVAGGNKNGGCEVSHAMSFLNENKDESPIHIAKKILQQAKENECEGEVHLAPGFGQNYGNIDEFTRQLFTLIKEDIDDITQFPMLNWVIKMDAELNKQSHGILKVGLAAVVFIELGITNRQAIGLFQLICAPGIFAQGVEQTHKPITAIPMPSDDQHIYQTKT